MIATNIDGSVSNSNPLMDLLKVVADPAAYTAKVKELEEATARYQEVVALAGPASEIVAIREQIAMDQREAKAALADAKTKAAGIVKNAETKAEALLSEADAKAKAELDEAAKKSEEAQAAEERAKVALANAEAANINAAKVAKTLDERTAALDAEIAAAKKARMEAEELKADIVYKHQSFIASL